MEAIAPTSLAEPWDNVGLLVGDPGASLSRVLIAIDCTREVLGEAAAGGAGGALVAYHPVIFEAQKRFVAGSVAFEAARAGLAVYCPHTALDVAEGGTNDVLADAVGMRERAALRAARGQAPQNGQPLGAALGVGRVGAVATTTLGALIDRVKRVLGADRVMVAGALDREVTRVAVCAGSGGDLLDDAVTAGAEVLLTGELRHHDVLRAEARGIAVVCARHSTSERAALVPLARRLAERLPGIAVTTSVRDREPLSFV
jgi:dinuclear metal center YbgI/SA1388 family protein